MEAPLRWLAWLRERSEILTSAAGFRDDTLRQRPSASLTRWRIVAIAAVFILALSVRTLCWQDHQVEIDRQETYLTQLVNSYRTEALRITEEGGVLVPNTAPESGDARMLVHPPGYSFLLAGLKDETSYRAIRMVQVITDAVSVVVVFLIAGELLGFATATVAGCLAALSPHLAYYSLWLSPDSLVALPTLLAVWLLIKGIKSRQLAPFVASGCLIGVACWLRSNSLLLAPFLSLLVWLVFYKGDRSRFFSAAVLTAAAIAVIAPLTIRNLIVFRRLIPTSIGNGITLIEGIADYDPTDRLGMPGGDDQASVKDSEWYGRPDYAGNLWVPDGIRRDQDRFRRGLGVVASHPLWFLSVMVRRAGFMLRYNDGGAHQWPLNTALVPIVSSEPAFGHEPSDTPGSEPVDSISAVELAQQGTVRSSGAVVDLSADSKRLSVTGDASPYGPQFASQPIPVKEKTDYLLDVRVNLESGAAAVEIMDIDQRATLASCIVPQLETIREALALKERRGAIRTTAPITIDPSNQDAAVLHIVFSSGSRRFVRLVIGNNAAQLGPSVLDLGQVDLYEYGPTPYRWTRYPRILVHGIQKRLFTTGRMLPLVIIGALLLGLFGDKRSLLLLAAVPIYYLGAQSFLHTEYRYILPIHYFLFIFASITLCAGGTLVTALARRALDARKHSNRPRPVASKRPNLFQGA
jgi:hypothetical protein